MQNFVGKTKCIVGYMKVANCFLYRGWRVFSERNQDIVGAFLITVLITIIIIVIIIMTIFFFLYIYLV